VTTEFLVKFTVALTNQLSMTESGNKIWVPLVKHYCFWLMPQPITFLFISWCTQFWPFPSSMCVIAFHFINNHCILHDWLNIYVQRILTWFYL